MSAANNMLLTGCNPIHGAEDSLLAVEDVLLKVAIARLSAEYSLLAIQD